MGFPPGLSLPAFTFILSTHTGMLIRRDVLMKAAASHSPAAACTQHSQWQGSLKGMG